jgi:hypothetical protein
MKARMLEEMEQGEREESERREVRESTSSSELSEESLSSAAAVTSALSLSVCPSPRQRAGPVSYVLILPPAVLRRASLNGPARASMA